MPAATAETHLTLSALLGYTGGLITILTLIKGIYEYTRQRADKRAAQFLEMRKSFRENTGFQQILGHLYGDQDFKDVTEPVKYEFMGFFEDLGFLMNSGLIRKEVVFYMFGNDIISAWENDHFWSEERRADRYWSLLSDLAAQMKDIDKTFTYQRSQIRL